MDLAIHDEILWHACVKASTNLAGKAAVDPTVCFPYLVRGSWMNDMNQVSPLLDKVGSPDVGPQQATLFHGLWKLELEDLLNERAPRLPKNAELMAKRGQILAEPQNVHGFGQYSPFDHLDVPLNEPGSEYDVGWTRDSRLGRAQTANFTVDHYIPSRLGNSSLLDERFSADRLTILGRGLHTIADFFAHSNYVELLLWSLAWRGRLDPNIVGTFNFDDGSNDLGRPLLRCPLPMQGPRDGQALRNAVMWYGASPVQTPLVSALFDTNDTIFSLLHIYSQHLVRTDGKDQTEPALDLAMAVFDIQGAPLIKGAWEVLEAVEGVFSAIGRAARNLLASGIDTVAEGKDPATRELMHSAANLVRNYSSKEADDWAKANRLNFLSRQLEQQMLEELRGQTAGAMQLPHHSLLAKDHAGDEAGGRLRFKLACLLATDLTAKVLEWHFQSGVPSLDDYRSLARTVMIHPWHLLQAAGNGDKIIAERVRDASLDVRWQNQSLNGLRVLEGVL
jgi:hypothetical protein